MGSLTGQSVISYETFGAKPSLRNIAEEVEMDHRANLDWASQIGSHIFYRTINID